MTNRQLMTAAVALGLTTAGAFAAEPSQQEMLSQLNELKAKVAAMEGRTAVAADTQATIDSVLRDAQDRSQFLSAGDIGAGYDSGFFIKGDNWLMKPGLQFQFRNVTNWGDDTKNGGDSIQNGFEIRRMKLSFEGYALTKDLKYDVVFKTSESTGAVSLEDAYVTYTFADQLAVKGGQFKDPVFHEELTSSKRQLAVDRSLVNELLGGGVTDRVQGVALLYGDDTSPLKAEVAYTDGLNSDNTNFLDAGSYWGVAGRVEYKVMGAWKSYRDFTAMGTSEDMLVVGAGTDFSEGNDFTNFIGTVDAQYENAAGLGVYGAFLFNTVDNGEDFTDMGGIVQAGYMLNKQLEVFGRYGIIILDDDRNADEDTIHEITAGINYYMGTDGSAGHRAKVTVDATWLPNGSPSNVTGLGVLATEESEVIIRAQFQLLL